MKTIEINLYKFSELSEEAQQKAIESLADINTDHDWWKATYEDAENIGLKITGFGLNSYATAEVIDSHFMMAEEIVSGHGKDCDTHRIAKVFLKDWATLVAKYATEDDPERVAEENLEEFDPLGDTLEEAFLEELREAYRIILKKDYEYRTGKEAIIETIEANGYDFTEDGELNNLKTDQKVEHDPIEEAKKLLEDDGYLTMGMFHKDDIHALCDEHELPTLTDKQAKEVLQLVGSKHDAEVGINWDVLRFWIEQYCEDNGIK